MFPSVAFRPVRLLVISMGITAVAVVAAGLAGRLMVGVFFGIGLLLGLLNALLVRRSVESITATAHPLKRSMALNSASRLAVITILGLILAFVFRPAGIGVLFGIALFQLVLVASTALPVWKKLRSEQSTMSYASDQPAGSDGGALAADGTEERNVGDD